MKSAPAPPHRAGTHTPNSPSAPILRTVSSGTVAVRSHWAANGAISRRTNSRVMSRIAIWLSFSWAILFSLPENLVETAGGRVLLEVVVFLGDLLVDVGAVTVGVGAVEEGRMVALEIPEDVGLGAGEVLHAHPRHFHRDWEDRERLPQLPLRVVEVLPQRDETVLVNVDDALAVAVAAGSRRHLAHVDHINVSQFPPAPRRLAPSEPHPVLLGKLAGVAVDVVERQDAPLAEQLGGELGDVAVEAGAEVVAGHVALV